MCKMMDGGNVQYIAQGAPIECSVMTYMGRIAGVQDERNRYV